MTPLRVSSVFRLADRLPVHGRAQNIENIPVCDDPLPPRRPSGFVFGKGQGPWQIKAMGMKVGQSLKLSPPEAECFRGACRRLGYKYELRSLSPSRVQVQIVSKPTED